MILLLKPCWILLLFFNHGNFTNPAFEGKRVVKDGMTCNSPIPPTNFSCSSSSSLDEATNQKYSCKNVFDYRQLTSWAANSERVGAWIFIDLNNYYKLSHIILRRRFRGVGYDYKAEIKGITIQISDGSRKRNDELPKKEIIRLLVGSYLNSTQTINLTVTAVFNTFTTSSEQSQIGFSEIKFCGSKTNESKRLPMKQLSISTQTPIDTRINVQNWRCKPGQGGKKPGRYEQKIKHINLKTCQTRCLEIKGCIAIDYANTHKHLSNSSCRLYKLDEKRTNPGRHNRTYCTVKGISIKTFVGNWTVVGGNGTIMCDVTLNSASVLSCSFSNAFLQTFLHDGDTIKSDDNPQNEGTYNINASITWTNGGLWVKDISRPPPELEASTNIYVPIKEPTICEGKALFDSLTVAMEFCDKFECQGIHDEFCDGTSISTCKTLNNPDVPDMVKHGCTYKKEVPSQTYIYVIVGVVLLIMAIAIFLFIFVKRRLDTDTTGVFDYIISGKGGTVNPNRDLKAQVSQIGIDKKREISRKSFVIKDEIGSGNFGKVYKGKVNALDGTKSKTIVAIKSITDSVDNDEIKNFLYEIKIMGFIDPHLNLVSMVGSCTSELGKTNQAWLLLEFCDHGDLKHYLINHKQEILSEEVEALNTRCLVMWAYDVAKGMQYLSDKKIMHGDLAARNVLLDDDPKKSGYLVAKVADFGLSRKFYENVTYEKQNRLLVPWKWMAFEYLMNEILMLQSDVWSYGILFWEIFSFAQVPYGHQAFEEVLEKLKDGYRLPCPDDVQGILAWSPPMLYMNVSKLCFVENPQERGSFGNIIELLEKELSFNERHQYGKRYEEYQTNQAKDYLAIGGSKFFQH